MGSSSSKPVLTEKEERLLNEARRYVEKNGLKGINDFYDKQVAIWEKFELVFAIIGSRDLGKSSFINAIKGSETDENEAARNAVSTWKTTYSHFKYKNIKLCDLPGIGTPENPNLETYCKNNGGLEKYDAFLIFSRSNFTDHEKNMIKKVSKELQRPFVCVYTHVVVNVRNANKQSETNGEIAYDGIRKLCIDNLRGLAKDTADIYIIDNNDTGKYDFHRLRNDVILKLLKRQKECFLHSLNLVIYRNKELTEEDRRLEEAKFRINKNGLIDVDKFIRDQIESWKNMKIHLALTGRIGAGKSSFINAVRGLKGHEKGAAPVDVTEIQTEPTEYIHPKNENIKLWDLPGIGSTKYPNLTEYFKKMDLKSYDAFLIFSKSRFTNDDKELAVKFSKELNKPFFFIRTNIDQDLKNAEDDKGPQFNEVFVLENMRKDSLKNLGDYIHDEKDVFLIDSKVPEKYDFNRLCGDVVSKLLERRSQGFLRSLTYVIYKNNSITDDDRSFAEAKDRFDRKGICGIGDFYHRQINSFKEVKINLAITGDSGAGKSSFINAVRGLKGHEKEAAPVGVTETTTVPTKYAHPNNENIIFWDLPGIGTPTFPNLNKYCKKVDGLEKYDAFLIFCKTRFTQYNKELAEKVSKELNKPFFFVRTHVHIDLKNAKDDKGPKFDKASVLKEMGKNCLKNLEGFIKDESDIFLIDNHVPKKYDFDRLVEAISLVLPERRRECFILSLTNLTRDCIKRKAKLLKTRAGAVAVAAAGVNAAPVPVVGSAFNLAVVFQEIHIYRRQFGFPDKGTKEFEALNKESSTVLFKYILVNESWTSIAEFALELGLEENTKFIPIVGPLLSSTTSFFMVYHFLHKCINNLEKVALDIWDETVQNNGS